MIHCKGCEKVQGFESYESTMWLHVDDCGDIEYCPKCAKAYLELLHVPTIKTAELWIRLYAQGEDTRRGNNRYRKEIADAGTSGIDYGCYLCEAVSTDCDSGCPVFLGCGESCFSNEDYQNWEGHGYDTIEQERETELGIVNSCIAWLADFGFDEDAKRLSKMKQEAVEVEEIRKEEVKCSE